MPRPDFQVARVEPDGLVIGTNCGDETPIGTVFTTIERIRIDGDLPDLTIVELGPIASVRLALQEVHLSRHHTVKAIPRGYSVGLRLEGDGIRAVLDALRAAHRREHIHIRGPDPSVSS